MLIRYPPMKFIRTITFLLVASLCTSCISDAQAKRIAEGIGQIIVQTVAFSGLAVQYREQNGKWPSDPHDVLLGTPPDLPSDIDLQGFCDRVQLRPTAAGLVVSDKKSGETLFTIGNESSTKEGVRLVGEPAGG
jgi:hypothetical protein